MGLGSHREVIKAYEDALADRLRSGLAAIEGVTTYSIFGPEHERVGAATFTIDGLDSSLVSAALSAQYGIGVRDGKFCAHLLVDALFEGQNTEDSPDMAVRDEDSKKAVRASNSLAITPAHLERLLRAIETLAEKGPAFEYQRTSQGWAAVGDPRDLTLPRPWYPIGPNTAKAPNPLARQSNSVPPRCPVETVQGDRLGVDDDRDDHWPTA